MGKRTLPGLGPGSVDGLLKPPHDPYWDGNITRREAQAAVDQLSQNDKALADQNDTTNLMVNFLLEKLGVTRAEADAWIAKKAEEINRRKAMLLKMEELGLLKRDPETGQLIGASAEEVAKFREEHPDKFKEVFVSAQAPVAQPAADAPVPEVTGAEPTNG